MPSTVGAWARQLPSWLSPDAVASRFRPTVIASDGSRRLLDDDYAVLDTGHLASLGGFEVHRVAGSADSRAARADGPAVHVDRPEGADALGEWTRPDVVVDAVGSGSGEPVLGARQLAFGQIFGEEDLPADVRVAALMDFTVPGGDDATETDAATDCPATFSYRIPLGDGRWLIEETILAARASGDPDDPRRAELHAHLRRMQARRLADLGVDAETVTAEEIVDFPMGPRRLPGSATPGLGRFGAGGGWMHPATGYSVGAVLADVDRFLDRLESRADASPPGGRPLAWLRRRGLHVLLGFDADQSRDFFDAFLSLPDAAIREYLTGASTTKTLAVMIRLAIPLGRRNPATLGRLLVTFLDGRRSATSQSRVRNS